MKNEIGQKLIRTFAIFVVCVIVVGGLATAYPTWRRNCALKERERELDARIAAKTREIARLKEYQERFQTDSAFVELIARRNRRVYANEFVFVFDE